MIIYISNNNYSKQKIILSESEIINIIPNIKWVKDDDYLFAAKNDRLSKSEIKNIIKSNPNFDFLIDNDCIEIDTTICRDFSVKEYLKNKTIEPKKGVSPVFGSQTIPTNNSPTFLIGSERLVWKSEIGLFEKTINNYLLGFYNNLNKSLVFKELKQYDRYLEEIIILESLKEKYMAKEERFVRVITVYDKSTKELKYRILNEEFNYNSFAHFNITPIENDELFFRSYLITEKISKQYLDWAYIDVDFDFDKNEYYFETLSAETFTYSLSEVFKTI